MTSWWHAQRIDGVMAVLQAHRPAHVLDLGCGDGAFVAPLLTAPWACRITGLEPDPAALAALRARLTPEQAARVTLISGSALAPPAVPAVDAIVMLEVLEHLDPGQLSQLEHVLFARLDAPLVVLTTPNAEFNPLLGVPAHRLRHPEHRFEWTRARFTDWAAGVARRAIRTLRVGTLGGAHPALGGASQIAVFTRPERRAAPAGRSPPAGT